MQQTTVFEPFTSKNSANICCKISKHQYCLSKRILSQPRIRLYDYDKVGCIFRLRSKDFELLKYNQWKASILIRSRQHNRSFERSGKVGNTMTAQFVLLIGLRFWGQPGSFPCCDRKSRAAYAQSFALWQQATIEFTCHDHSIITCSRHIYVWCCSSGTSRSWWITQSTQHHRRGCNTPTKISR